MITKVIINMVKAARKKASCLLLLSTAALFLASCLDTVILPDDKTVDEDFWKTKEDVASMVNAAYAAMASENVITRLIVWGDYRSDEMTRTSSLTGSIPDALDEITAVSMQTTNQFATWAPFFDVINKCNIVLERAESVMLEDPNYTEYDYEADRNQMLALRSLCYFYLVRNYRDVPYIDHAFMNSSQNMQYAQTAPADVLQHIIDTLEEVAANGNTLRSNSYTVNEWRRVGWMTLDAVKSLLADVYLWRASVQHNAADYQRCVDLCEQVVQSKRDQHQQGRNELTVADFPLAQNDAYTSLFVNMNAEESIFELQSRANGALCKYFYKYGSDTSTDGFLKASSIFGTAGADIKNLNTNVFVSNDLRYYAACFFDSKTEGEAFGIRKMVSSSSVMRKETETRARATDRRYDSYAQNYIIYRLPDVMLMEAEALTQLLEDTPEEVTDAEKNRIDSIKAPVLRRAFTLVQAVNTRSIYTDDKKDSLKWDNYRNYSKSQMETLVMQERLRELCFEGKRWYDLMRYHYRHAESTPYNRTYGELAEAAGDGELALPSVYKEMLALMTRSRGNDAPAIQAKMRNEAYLYLPVPNSELNVCPLLKQNPVYNSTNAYEKNY